MNTAEIVQRAKAMRVGPEEILRSTLLGTFTNESLRMLLDDGDVELMEAIDLRIHLTHATPDDLDIDGISKAYDIDTATAEAVLQRRIDIALEIDANIEDEQPMSMGGYRELLTKLSITDMEDIAVRETIGTIADCIVERILRVTASEATFYARAMAHDRVFRMISDRI